MPINITITLWENGLFSNIMGEKIYLKLTKFIKSKPDQKNWEAKSLINL